MSRGHLMDSIITGIFVISVITSLHVVGQKAFTLSRDTYATISTAGTEARSFVTTEAALITHRLHVQLFRAAYAAAKAAPQYVWSGVMLSRD